MIKIHNWGELSELEPSSTHYLNINLEYGYGRLINKDGTKEEYLSTHTFYGYGVMEYISKKLQSCGFNVELIGWDKEFKKVLLLNSCGYGLDKDIEIIQNISQELCLEYKPYTWYDHQREHKISKRDRFKIIKIRRKK